MATDTEIEAMSIFGLLDPTNTGELHIKQVNSLLHKFEALGDRNKPETTMEEIPSKASETPVKSSLAIGNSPLFSHRKSVIIKKGVKKVQSDHLIARRESFQSGPPLKKRESHEEYFGRLVDSPKLEMLDKPEKSKFEFNNFPNKKKEIGLNEFTTIYTNNFVDHPIQDDVLLKCFSTFDYNKQGFLDTKAVKEIFELFGEKPNDADIENLFKFLGCKNERMNYQEFVHFFKKNI